MDSDFKEITRERGKCNEIDEAVAEDYRDRFLSSIDMGVDGELIDAYENLREIRRLFNVCWSVFGVAAMSLHDGETKFSVVPKAVENINKIKVKLRGRLAEMVAYTEKYQDQQLRGVMLDLLSKSNRELYLIDRYISFLTKY